MTERYAYAGPINHRWRSRPRFEWRDYILALLSRYKRHYTPDDWIQDFQGNGDWWLNLNNEGIAEVRKIALGLGYADPKDRAKDSWEGIEPMLMLVDALDVGALLPGDRPDPRPMLRRLAGIY